MSTKEPFAKRIQRIMGNSVSLSVPRGCWQGREYAHIFSGIESNFVDGTYPTYCSLKGDLTDAKIKYHKGAAHMNSSQVMCISFFKKFFERPEYEKYLLAVLRESGINIESKENIEAAVFEYEPCATERTNFDFYLVFSSGKRISFEIKYTEPEFGGISPDKDDPHKYDRKWNTIYKSMVEKSVFLDTDKDAFYEHYQVNRNIAYAKEGDYVVFLTPKANNANVLKNGRDYIDRMKNPHIRNLYWEDVVEITLKKLDECDELKAYYSRFYNKYIKILDL